MRGSENFPIQKYYQDNIVDAITISRKGIWWTAILLIKDPEKNNKIIKLYRWKMVNNKWKITRDFPISEKKLPLFIDALIEFKENS